MSRQPLTRALRRRENYYRAVGEHGAPLPELEPSEAINEAVDRMAAGIRDEFEFEEIVRRAAPASRAAMRARLIPHLRFELVHCEPEEPKKETEQNA